MIALIKAGLKTTNGKLPSPTQIIICENWELEILISTAVVNTLGQIKSCYHTQMTCGNVVFVAPRKFCSLWQRFCEKVRGY